MMPWMLLVLVSRKVKGMPVGVEPTFSTCCADAGIAAATNKGRHRGLNETFESHRTTSWIERRRPPARLDQRVAGNAVPAYFHQYEIVVTLAGALQAIFMHMKEAV